MNTPPTLPWPPGLRACFVTGTDTEIGKTTVSAALLHWGARQGWRSAGFKPVAAGTEWVDGERCNDDVRTLRRASSLPLDDADICPFQYDDACAPHIAAERAARPIVRAEVHRAALALAQRADLLVVEGVGGFRVPFGAGWDSADLAQDLALPVLLVVGLRLGCINHALLSAEAVRARGLRLAGWIGNGIDPHMGFLEHNTTALRERLRQEFAAPCLGVVPPLSDPSPERVAQHLDDAALHALWSPPQGH